MIDKEMNALHRAYNKHEWVVVGKAKWDGDGDGLVYRCACGDYAFCCENEDGEVRMVPYRTAMTGEWMLATLRCLNNKKANELLSNIWRHRSKLEKEWGYQTFWEVFGVRADLGYKTFTPWGKR